MRKTRMIMTFSASKTMPQIAREKLIEWTNLAGTLVGAWLGQSIGLHSRGTMLFY